MLKKFLYICGICAWASVSIIGVYAYEKLDRPSGFVSDFARVLSVDQKTALEQKLSTFEKETSNEIAVVIIDSLKGDYIENYAVKLFADWGIGKKDKDNGVLFLVAVSDRAMRIEVGYGLEGALTDALSVRILDDNVRPFFKQNDYAGGIGAGVDAIISATKGEYKASSTRATQSSGEWLFFVLFGILWGGGWLFSIMVVLGRSKSWWAGGIVGGVLGAIVWIVLGVWWGAVSVLIFGVVGLLLDRSMSRSYQRAIIMGTLPWWAKKRKGGGGFFGGSGGGGGFGGFSGGSSGGGGGSSSW
ncbi:MAG: TPM domain-containing protein [Candidatus Pacebacteria bacterium]|nr:TPM domain-containing protein [Candidatus Paceibacterota bacterium]